MGAKLVAVVLGLASMSAAATTHGSEHGTEALRRAFDFASAIEADPRDQARSQEDVIRDLAAIGALDEALSRVERVDGWRRGVLYADLAAELARRGRIEEARALVARAEEVRSGVEGWQNPRIAAHVAQSWATLGELDATERVSRVVAQQDAQQYAGRAATLVSEGHAARGDFVAAAATLDRLAAEEDIYVAWWRTVAWIELGENERFEREQRVRALETAETSATGISGWKRAEALNGIAKAWHELGRDERARPILKQADALVEPLADRTGSKPHLLAMLARTWGAAGDVERARELLRDAEAIVPSLLEIDRPGVRGNLAASWAVLGDTEHARVVLDTALAEAEGLVNARPRALAVVAVLRALGRNDVRLEDATKARLDTLYTKLGAPW